MGTREYILKMRKQINQWREIDQKARSSFLELEEQSQEIQNTFKEIQSLDQNYSTEQEKANALMKLNEAMEELNQFNKLAMEDYLEYATTKFPEFATRYPGMFKMFLTRDVDNEALIHCLDTFSRVEKGELGFEQGKEVGFKRYMKM